MILLDRDILDSLNSSSINLINEGQRLLDAIRNEEQDPVYSQLFLYLGLSEIISSLNVNYLLNIDTKSLRILRNKIAHPKRKRNIEELIEIKSNFDTIFNNIELIKSTIISNNDNNTYYESEDIIEAIRQYCSKDMYIRFINSYYRLAKDFNYKSKIRDEQNYILVMAKIFSKEEIGILKSAILSYFGEDAKIYIKEIKYLKFDHIKSMYNLKAAKMNDSIKLVIVVDNKIFDIDSLDEVSNCELL